MLGALAERYCTITLGGPHLGFASILEQRAEGGYGAVVDELIDLMGFAPGAVAVDVGCGTRRLARRVNPTGRVVGLYPSRGSRRSMYALPARSALDPSAR